MFRNTLKTTAFALAALTLTGSAVMAQNGNAFPGQGQFQNGPMTGARLGEIIRRIDPNAANQGNAYEFSFAERRLIVVFDENAGRMRAMTPIGPADVLSDRLMQRMLQANFDAVLDARYAVSQDLIWSVFIHPLPTLTEVDFTSGLVQVAIAAQTFGTEFTSGEVVFGGGDSAELNRQLQQSIDPNNDRGI